MGSLPDIQTTALWATAISVVTLLISFVVVPWAIKRLPADYFVRSTRTTEARVSIGLVGFVWFVWVIFKNALGLFLLLAGVVMLFTPGQGLLTLLMGMLLMDFPGKYRLERALVGRARVMRTLNWLRRKQGCPDFLAPLPPEKKL